MRNYWGRKNPSYQDTESRKIKAEQYRKENPFSLFDNTEEWKKLKKKAEEEFNTAFQKFIRDWYRIQKKYSVLGTYDTMSREAQYEWIMKEFQKDHNY
jgi:hypothetical protein